MNIVSFVYNLLWGDLVTIPLPGGSSLGLSLIVILLIPTGIFCTVITRFLPIRLFPEMLRLSIEKKSANGKENALSGIEALIVSTATRVGMGNLVGVVAAVSAGGPGAVFWMWITAMIGSGTAFVEATLSQIYKEKDPLYGGYRGGPAYYLHSLFKGRKKKSVIAVLFALSGLLCWCGISQVIGNSVSSAFENAFNVPPIATAVILCAISAFIVLRKNISVKVLDVIVPIMATFYFLLTVYVIITNIGALPSVFSRIFHEAFGIRQAASGAFGTVLMNGVKRGLFSNEAGSGSAPCAAAAADVNHPVKSGLLQALGVFIDTIVICSCTAFMMLIVPETVTNGLGGMDLLQAAMKYYFGNAGVIFIALTLWFFCFSTFIGILFYARSNVAYIFGDNWTSQTVYKLIAIVNLFIGCMAAYTFVWDLGDVGIGLMTVFNVLALIPLSKEAVESLKDYEMNHMKKRKTGGEIRPFIKKNSEIWQEETEAS
ncbi:alanine or glycine:cation symporter, AGCS family [Lachnospiraceae bacterium]|nr:alanine or glycine:cation symporter, AGCS family [Lachnospiraceae bacterium]